MGKRQRRIRARSAIGQVAGAATEKHGLEAHRPITACPMRSPKKPLSRSPDLRHGPDKNLSRNDFHAPKSSDPPPHPAGGRSVGNAITRAAPTRRLLLVLLRARRASSLSGASVPALTREEVSRSAWRETRNSPVAQPTPPPVPIGVSVRAESPALPRKEERVLARSWLIAPPGSADPGRRRDDCIPRERSSRPPRSSRAQRRRSNRWASASGDGQLSRGRSVRTGSAYAMGRFRRVSAGLAIGDREGCASRFPHSPASRGKRT